MRKKGEREGREGENRTLENKWKLSIVYTWTTPYVDQ